MLTQEALNALRARYERGEKITRLAREAGVSWQKLHGLLNPAGAPAKRPARTARRRRRSGYTHGAGSGVIQRVAFGSMTEALQNAFSDKATSENSRRTIASILQDALTGHDEWANHHTRATLEAMLGTPPQALMDAVGEMARTLADEVCPPTGSRRRIRRNQEYGEEMNPEAVALRSLTPFERQTRETTPRHSVTVGINVSVHGGRTPEELLWRGAAAVALSDALSRMGVNVELVAFWTSDGVNEEGDAQVSRYRVKRADMPMDVGTAAVMLSEIGFARIVYLVGRARHVAGTMNPGLGRSRALPDEDRQGLDYLADYDILSRTQAEAWLRECLDTHRSAVCQV